MNENKKHEDTHDLQPIIENFYVQPNLTLDSEFLLSYDKRSFSPLDDLFNKLSSDVSMVLYNSSNHPFKILDFPTEQKVPKTNKGRPISSSIQVNIYYHLNLENLLYEISKEKKKSLLFFLLAKKSNNNIFNVYNPEECGGSNDLEVSEKNVFDKFYYLDSKKKIDCNQNNFFLSPRVVKINSSCRNIHEKIKDKIPGLKNYLFIKLIRDCKGHVLKTQTIKPAVISNEYFYSAKWIKENVCSPRYKKNMNLHILQGDQEFLIYHNFEALLSDLKNDAMKFLEKTHSNTLVYVKKN
ncbi:hypothetical protein DAMA08_032870 [Martiniozyma asiatica (nom. inval.)]|nr:hypothetical protein DAMA08_032870 [Martiniozyma asiatica]